MSFSSEIKEKAFVACGRFCSICHKFCGLKIEVHHIVEVGNEGDDSFDNAIPLCFDCHADMRSYDSAHPKGNKYTRSELKTHRDLWYKKVRDGAGLAPESASRETDKAIFQQFNKLMPWDGTIRKLRLNGVTQGRFPWAMLDDLVAFDEYCLNPAFQFIDPDLEALRSTLHEYVRIFRFAVLQEIFEVDDHDGWGSIPKEWLNEDYERYLSAEARLEHETQRLLDAYDSLVKSAIRKLGILPSPEAM